MADFHDLITTTMATGVTTSKLSKVMQVSWGTALGYSQGKVPRSDEPERLLRAWWAEQRGNREHAFTGQEVPATAPPEPDPEQPPSLDDRLDDPAPPPKAVVPDAETEQDAEVDDPSIQAITEDLQPEADPDSADATVKAVVDKYASDGRTLDALEAAISFAIYEQQLDSRFVDPVARELLEAGAKEHYSLATLRDRILKDLQRSGARKATQPPPMPEAEVAALSADLRKRPDLLEHGVATVHAMGVVGEIAAIKAVILASVSRLFPKPSHLLLLGDPGTGKTTVVEAALRLLPPNAVKSLNNMSPRALAYTDFDFRNTVFFLSEGTPLSGHDDDPAKSMLRTLISEARVVYETVQPDPSGVLQTTRLEKEGPISFITCHVAPFKESQIASRLIEVPTDQSTEQATAVLQSLAREAAGKITDATDAVEQWQALHGWLAYQPTRVVIPYALTVVDLFGQVSSRSARDLNQLLALIKASAFLHSGTRDLDGDGRVIATLADYQHAHDALAVGIDAAAETQPHGNVERLLDHLKATLTDPPRKSGMPKRAHVGVADPIIGKVLECSQQELAKAMQMSRSTLQRAVWNACDSGYLENSAPRQTSRMRLEILWLPNEKSSSTLPSPTRLAAVLTGAPDPAKCGDLVVHEGDKDGRHA